MMIHPRYCPYAAELPHRGLCDGGKGNPVLLIDDITLPLVSVARVVLIINVALAFCDWLSQCPVHFSLPADDGRCVRAYVLAQ